MTHPVAVRTLCNFTAKSGDLDRRFTPAPTAQEGIAGQAMVARRRGGGYQTEVWLTGEYENLRLRGRADGYDPKARRLDECKTFRGDLARMPANHRALHWAQLKVYGALLCERDAMPHIDLALIYFDADSQQETVLEERFDAQTLREFFNRSCGQFSEWADHEASHISARDAWLSRMSFPFGHFHSGQRQLAEAVYRAACAGHCLLAQAPTGIGKTVGTLFPMLKSMAKGHLDKIYYLAAKSTGRQLALDALQLLTRDAPKTPVRVLELVARAKACVYPDKECHGASCPLAAAFYDKLPLAREAALACEVMDQATLRAVAVEHGVCPYYLSQEMVRWSDVIIGDYNYYFDYGGLLYGLTLENEWRVGVLVDEAHNLIERARQMNTAALSATALEAAMGSAPPAIARLMRQTLLRLSEIARVQSGCYRAYEYPLEPVVAALERTLARLTEYAVEHYEQMGADLREFYFAAMQFCRLAESFDAHSLFDVSSRGQESPTASTLSIRNVIPAFFLKARFERARCAVLFSGTLNPWQFYQDMLGLPANTRRLDVPSPFGGDQLSVRVIGDISTRLRHRPSSLQPISRIIARQYAREPGNYLVFLGSFDYLEALFASFTARHPDIAVWKQSRSMSEGERHAFIERFAASGRGIGFAVLGGAFAEGIDLPGERLIGAFIATLGMPQVTDVNEAMSERVQAIFGLGHEYTYLYPGLQRVAQAAGRVIRSTSDRGTLFLIDDRYNRMSVRRLLPNWWQLDAATARATD